jgi:hypothetical protein
MADKFWEEAISWYRGSLYQDYIRKVAVAKMLVDWPEGEGLGSSDQAAGIVNLYREWLDAKDRATSLMAFLVDEFSMLPERVK